MFITNPNDESIDPEDDDSSGRKMWQRVHQVLEWPSFHVSIACGGKVEFVQTSEISDWIKLPRLRRDDPWLVEPRLISPGWLNGSGGWKMEVLREVWEGNEPALPVSVLVFVTEDGGRYVDSELGTAAAMLTDLRKIYPS